MPMPLPMVVVLHGAFDTAKGMQGIRPNGPFLNRFDAARIICDFFESTRD